MSGIVRLNQLPEGSGNLTSDDIFVFMDDPSGSAVTKKISLSEIVDVIPKSQPFDPTILINDDNSVSAYMLTSIWDNQFENFTAIGLRIGDSVTSIGNDAFYFCSGFTGNLTIPDSVTTIGSNAFNNCSGFTGNLTIPDSVTTIGDYAFNSCAGFNGSLTIGNSVTSIGNYAFHNCINFTNINSYVARSVLDITNPFQGCTNITTLHARASDSSWTTGSDTIGGITVTVIKDL